SLHAATGLRKDLSTRGIAHQGVLSDTHRVTTVKTRIIAQRQHVVRVDREQREELSPNVEGRLLREISTALNRLDALVISDYDKGIVTEKFAERVLSAAHRQKVPVFVAPKRSLLYAYRGARSIVCNTKEAGSILTITPTDDQSVADAGRKLLAHFGV